MRLATHRLHLTEGGLGVCALSEILSRGLCPEPPATLGYLLGGPEA